MQVSYFFYVRPEKSDSSDPATLQILHAGKASCKIKRSIHTMIAFKSSQQKIQKPINFIFGRKQDESHLP